MKNKQNRSKINQLLKTWPHGTVFTSAWLEAHGYSYDLINLYRKSEWLRSLGRGAVVRTDDDDPHWTGGVYALQTQLNMQVYPAGSTALALRGYAHNVQFLEQLFLFGAPGERLPRWFAEHDWEVELVYRTSNLFPLEASHSLEDLDRGSFSITVSAPERAIMELLLLVPKYQSFEQAMRAMESLLGLRPDLIQKLLEECNSVKVKRAFLYLADSLSMPWFGALQVNKIDLGHGKRVIAKGGRFNSKYQISVPYLEELGP